MKIRTFFVLLLTLMTDSRGAVLAAQPVTSPQGVTAPHGAMGPHGGHVMTQEGCQYEVVLDEKQKKVEVYASRLPTPTPSQLTLQLKKGNKIIDRVSLELMESHQDFHRFQGTLSPWHQQSSTGIQFRIELGGSGGKAK